jgi:putative sterol carrier protein
MMSEVREIFQQIDTALSNDASHAKGLEAVYQFELDGEGTYHIVFKGENSYAAEGAAEDPNCTLIMTAEDFKQMAEGNLNGTKAFMTGRLKIKGNMGLALKLQDILSSYKATF